MELLHFSDYEDFACEISDKFISLADEFDDITIVAKYEEAKEIIKELACFDYSIVSISLRRPDWDNYTDEYLISLNSDGIWYEPMKRNDNYIEDNSSVIYILDNCSSKVISHCNSKEMYEVCINDGYDDEIDEENTECVCETKDCKECTIKSDDDNSTYHITIKGDLDVGDAEKIIENMQHRIMHIQDMFDEINRFDNLLCNIYKIF